MKIVIDIPENVYKFVTTECKDVAISETKAPIEYIIRGIIDGIPLPKGHGDLVDADKVILGLVYGKHIDNAKCGEIAEIFDNAVVIPADMGGKEE